jgi:hypothetical protein
LPASVRVSGLLAKMACKCSRRILAFGSFPSLPPSCYAL